MDENVWPSFVTVSEWFFKQKSNLSKENTTQVLRNNQQNLLANESEVYMDQDTNTITVIADVEATHSRHE